MQEASHGSIVPTQPNLFSGSDVNESFRAACRTAAADARRSSTAGRGQTAPGAGANTARPGCSIEEQSAPAAFQYLGH